MYALNLTFGMRFWISHCTVTTTTASMQCFMLIVQVEGVTNTGPPSVLLKQSLYFSGQKCSYCLEDSFHIGHATCTCRIPSRCCLIVMTHFYPWPWSTEGVKVKSLYDPKLIHFLTLLLPWWSWFCPFISSQYLLDHQYAARIVSAWM